MQDETRQTHGNFAELTPEPEVVETNTIIEGTVGDLSDLITQRTTLENYRDQLQQAGVDGLDPVAKQIMLVNLQQLKLAKRSTGMESFDYTKDHIALEDFKEWLSNLGEKIKALIQKLINLAKEYASKLTSGLMGVKKEAETLMDRVRNRGRKPANELHDSGNLINIDSPSILWANGEFCNGDCKSEQEVIKFFGSVWPKYAKDQITRAKKMISEYDVESGNSENFEANIGFIGNHQSLVANIEKLILPGNKQVGFKYVALGPELKDAEDAEQAPANYSFAARTTNEINNTLKANVANMSALSQLFKSESEVLHDMASLSDALMGLENRRSETVWKSARDGLDDISKAMMDLITKLKPGYDPIVRHLAKVGAARNAVCRKELDALGQ